MANIVRFFVFLFALTMSSLGFSQTQFFSGAPIPPAPVPQITCDITTGVSSGASGPCASPVAACNNVTDDRLAFLSFRTWALANQGSSRVRMDIPNGAVCFISGSTRFAANINKLLVVGYGATLTNHGSGSPGFFLAGQGMQNANGEHNFGSKIATVSAGATSVTVLDLAKMSLFVVGKWVLVAGFDMQATWYGQFGYPVNPAYYDYVQITAVDSMTGIITFSQPLTYDYKSTWPEVSIDAPGPGWIYQLNDSWDAEVEYQGVTIDQPIGTNSDGRSVTLTDTTFTGFHGPTPSQNKSFTAANLTCTSCLVEGDKIIDTINISGATVSQFTLQSIAPKVLTISSLTGTISGTGRKFVGNNITAATFRVGVTAYGRAEETVCTNCILGTTASSSSFAKSSVLTRGVGDFGVNNSFTMASGVIVIPNGQRISAVSDNGSGKTRLTIPTSAGFVTGNWVRVENMAFRGTGIGQVGPASTVMNITSVTSGVFTPGQSCAGNFLSGGPTIQPYGTGGSTGTGGVGTYILSSSQTVPSGTTITCTISSVSTNNYQVTVVDGTNVDLTTLNVPAGPAGYIADSGKIHAGNPMNWAVPRTNLQWVGLQESETAFYVTDVTQDAANIYVTTNLAAGFPAVDRSSGGTVLGISVHPAPKWTCTNCTGAYEVTEQALAIPGAPLYSYYKQTFDGSSVSFTAQTPHIWGSFVALNVNVITAYTGTRPTLTFSPFTNFTTYKSDYSKFTYSPIINVKTGAERDVAVAGVTCTPSSPCPATGDSALTVPEAVWMTGQPSAVPSYSNSIVAECASTPMVCPSISVEIITNQGVISPLRRLANDNRSVTRRRRRRAA